MGTFVLPMPLCPNVQHVDATCTVTTEEAAWYCYWGACMQKELYSSLRLLTVATSLQETCTMRETRKRSQVQPGEDRSRDTHLAGTQGDQLVYNLH